MKVSEKEIAEYKSGKRHLRWCPKGVPRLTAVTHEWEKQIKGQILCISHLIGFSFTMKQWQTHTWTLALQTFVQADHIEVFVMLILLLICADLSCFAVYMYCKSAKWLFRFILCYYCVPYNTLFHKMHWD